MNEQSDQMIALLCPQCRAESYCLEDEGLIRCERCGRWHSLLELSYLKEFLGCPWVRPLTEREINRARLRALVAWHERMAKMAQEELKRRPM